MDAVALAKLDRLRRGGSPRYSTCFSGCGGMSLGFHRAGFSIVAGVDKDPEAALSHATNFHAEVEPSLRELHAQPRDVSTDNPIRLLQGLGHADP